VTINPAQFRVDFPEFADTTAYPDAGINFWLGVAYKLLNACRFQDMLDTAAELYVAHNIALERQAQKSASGGAVPGLSTGPVSSKTVGPVTQAYDTTAGIFEDAGPWNLTIYGTRLYNLFMMFGAGPIQL
jgi:hypothetical protein